MAIESHKQMMMKRRKKKFLESILEPHRMRNVTWEMTYSNGNRVS
jgi:hypothetical protein